MKKNIKLFILTAVAAFSACQSALVCAANDAAAGVNISVSADAAVAADTASSEPESGAVHGRIFELGTHNTVENVLLEVKGTSLTAESDPGGYYEIKLPAGEGILIFTAQGYSPATKNISIKSGRDIELNVHMEKTYFTSDTVVVQAKKAGDQVVGSTITQNEIKKTPGNAGDALRAVQDMPGVAAPSDYSSQLVVQGGGPDDNLYLLDNIPWPEPFHFGGLVSTVNSDLLSSVDLYGTGFGAKWGDYMGSVLDAKTAAGRKDGLYATADINMIMSQALLEGPLGIGDASFTVAGRRSYIDLVLGGYMKSFSITALPAFWDIGGTLDFTLGPDNRFHGLALGSNDFMSLLVGENMGVDPEYSGDYSVNNYSFTTGMSWVNTSIHGLTSTLTPYYYSTKQRETMGDCFNINSGENYFGIKEEAVWDAGELLGMKHELGFGGNFGAIGENAEAYYFISITDGIVSDPASATINSRLYERSAYLQDRIQINTQWAFIPGVRYDKRDDVAHDTLFPRMRLEYRYDDSTLWKAAWGYYGQFPTAEQLNAEYGNPYLSANIAEHMALSLEKKFSDSLNGSIDVYYKTYRNLVADITNPDGTETYNNKGFGTAKGVEFFLKERVDRFFGWISYALSQSERLDPQTGLWALYEYDEPSILNLAASYNITPAWSFGAKLRYNSGPFAESIKSSFFDGIGIWHPVLNETDDTRLGDYLRLDLRTDYTFCFEGWRLNLYLEIINALNRQNPAGTLSPEFGYTGGPDQINNLPRLIYFGMEFEF